MGSYVVRIYGEGKGDPPALRGVVMSVEDETRHPFRTAEELRQILAALEGRSSTRKQRLDQEVVRSGVWLTPNSREVDFAERGEPGGDPHDRTPTRDPGHD